MKILTEAYDIYLAHMKGRDHPKCYDSKEQFESWYEMEAFAHTKPRLFPCRDCTKEYREEMTKVGRCAQGMYPQVNKLMGKG